MNIIFIPTCWIPLLALSLNVNGQHNTRLFAQRDTLQLNERKTTNMAFTGAILQVDRGSADILVQRSPVAANLLQIKAAKENFAETNLSVLCDDGILHSFCVRYAAQPTSYLWQVTNSLQKQASAHVDTPISRYGSRARQALQKNPSLHLRQEKKQIGIELNGIFIHQDQMYFQFLLTNKSYIPFDIARFALQIRDNRRSKRKAVQELQVQPLYVLGDVTRLPSHSAVRIVVVTDKITLQEGKHLQLQCLEDRGARHQQFTIKNKYLLKALPLVNE